MYPRSYEGTRPLESLVTRKGKNDHFEHYDRHTGAYEHYGCYGHVMTEVFAQCTKA